jgi:hypothetical protein
MSEPDSNVEEIEKTRKILDGIEEKYLLGEINKTQHDTLYKKYNNRLQELLKKEEAFRMKKFTKDVYLRQIKTNLNLSEKHKIVEDSWSNIMNKEMYNVIALRLGDFIQKLEVLSVDRTTCQVFLDFDEKNVWIKEYGQDNKIYVTKAPFKMGSIN